MLSFGGIFDGWTVHLAMRMLGNALHTEIAVDVQRLDV